MRILALKWPPYVDAAVAESRSSFRRTTEIENVSFDRRLNPNSLVLPLEHAYLWGAVGPKLQWVLWATSPPVSKCPWCRSPLLLALNG